MFIANEVLDGGQESCEELHRRDRADGKVTRGDGGDNSGGRGEDG